MIINGIGRVVVGICCLIILWVIIEQLFGTPIASIIASWIDLAHIVAATIASILG